MTLNRMIVLVAAIALVSACGGGNVIDKAQDAYMAECPGHSFGEMVNGYFITGFASKTLWTAYSTEEAGTVRVTGEGTILYVGIETKATLEVLYKEDTDELFLAGVQFNGEPQPLQFAESLVSNMCDEAKGS